MHKYTLTTVTAFAALLWPFTMSNATDNFPSCERMVKPADVLECALELHPAVQLGSADLHRSSFEVERAAQVPNPEIVGQTLQTATGTRTELEYLHTFELGGKRSNRVKVAQSERQTKEIELHSIKASVAVDTVLNLYLLRHITKELSLARESGSSFEQVGKQYKRIGLLSPEQKISVSIFQTALEENNLKEQALLDKREEIIARLEIATGGNFRFSENILPDFKTKWPPVEVHEPGGYRVKAVENSIQSARARYSVELSTAWPDLTIGPKVEFENGQNEETTMGVAFSMQLPLYQTNKGGINSAMADLTRQTKKYSLTMEQVTKEISRNMQIYQRTRESLTDLTARISVEERHKELHREIRRGVIPATLVIEMHRQVLAYYENLHTRELAGIRALWRLYALEGSILERSIE